MKKDKKDKSIEIRLTAKEFHKLKLRAQLYSDGNVSKLIRHWINTAPTQFIQKTRIIKDGDQENETI